MASSSPVTLEGSGSCRPTPRTEKGSILQVRRCRRLPRRPSLTNSASWGEQSRVPPRRRQPSHPDSHPGPGRWPPPLPACPQRAHLGLADPMTPGAPRAVRPPPGPNCRSRVSAKSGRARAPGIRPGWRAPSPLPAGNRALPVARSCGDRGRQPARSRRPPRKA